MENQSPLVGAGDWSNLCDRHVGCLKEFLKKNFPKPLILPVFVNSGKKQVARKLILAATSEVAPAAPW